MKPVSPTLYPDVNDIVSLLLADVTEILRDQLLGTYIYGSLASGDFDEHSDIDVIVVTHDEISDVAFAALNQMHEHIQKIDSPWAIQLEVSYIPKAALRRYDPQNNQHPRLQRGATEKLCITQHDSDWVVQRYLLRERCIILAGPHPKTLIDPVSADDLRKAMYPLLFEWYGHFPDKPDPFGSRGYQSYTVLSLCRILYTLQVGEVVSKMAAASWAKEKLEPRWIPLIENALIGRQHPDLKPLPKDVKETLDMIRYALQRAKLTPYPDVNELLKLLLFNVKEILADQFVGMYLYGSLSSGDFNPETSDIDFLVVTASTLPNKTIAELQVLHHRIWQTGHRWAFKLEGSYIPKRDIRRHDPRSAPCPTVNEGKFYLDQRGSDWIIQRHVIREQGIVLAGPDPKTLIDPVKPDDIRRAVKGVLNEWWFPMLENPSWLKNHGSEYHAFAILSMCRALHTMEHGTVVSKRTAARWAQNKLSERWRDVIERSILAQKPREGTYDLFHDAIELIRYTKEKLADSPIRNRL